MRNLFKEIPYKVLGIILLITFEVHAQEKINIKDNSEWLSSFSEEQRNKAVIDKVEAIKRARTLNIPIKFTNEKGGFSELIRFEGNTPIYYTTYNEDAAISINTDAVYSGGGAGLNLSGNGVTLSEWDGGAVRLNHQELTGRITQVDGYAFTLDVNSDHATHVAGTMIAAGIVSSAKGMAFDADLDAYQWNNNLSEVTATSTIASNHSYGNLTGWEYMYTDNLVDYGFPADYYWWWFGDPSVSTTEDYKFGFYDTDSETWDDMLFNKPSHLMVKAAGNNRGNGPVPGAFHFFYNGGGIWSSNVVRDFDGGTTGYNSITDISNSKNILTVGAVNDVSGGYSGPSSVTMTTFSGWGPTDDGRIKPDIVANGYQVYSSSAVATSSYTIKDGTSMASPSVTGSIGLLLEHEKNLFGSNSFISSTWKAILTHSADDAGNTGPDYVYGWGLMNTKSAADIVSSQASSCNHIKEFNLADGNTIELYVDKVPSEDLKVTICWIDPAGTPVSASLNPTDVMLVNDLDLRITEVSSATTYSPYTLAGMSNPSLAAGTGDNSLDNIEQVLVSNLSGGTYKITINHKGSLSGGNQVVSVIITGTNADNDKMKLSGIDILDDTKSYSYNRLEIEEVTADNSQVDFTSDHSITFNPGSFFEAGSVINGKIESTCDYLVSDARQATNLSNSSNYSFEEEVDEQIMGETNYVYPNPASTGLVHFNKPVQNFILYDIAGREIIRGKNTNSMRIENIPKGVYLLNMDGDQQKLIIE